MHFLHLPKMDWVYLFILASFVQLMRLLLQLIVMRYISPYTVILSYNLEPVYGIAFSTYFIS